MNQITIGDITIDVIKKDIKNIHLGVYPPDGRVRIASPLKVTDETIRLFVLSKLTWIKKHQAKYQNYHRPDPREYVSGESHYFRGDRYLLNVIYYECSPPVIIRNKTHIDLYVKPGSSQADREKVMNNWYRQELKKLIPPLIDKWQKIIGVQVQEWRIKKMKTCWGTCNIQEQRIWLNLELIKHSPHCLEYVIVHELVHLLERHHNQRFISYMDKFMPTWRLYKEELNQRAPDYQRPNTPSNKA